MEALLKLQKAAVKNLNGKVENFDKDSPERKTQKYYKKKISELKDWYEEFKINHEKLADFDLKEQPYEKEKTFDNAVTTFNEHLKQLMAGLSAFDCEDDNGGDENLDGEAADNIGVTFGSFGANSSVIGDESSASMVIKLVYNDLAELIRTIDTMDEKTSNGYIGAQMDIARETFATFKKTYFEQMVGGNEVCKEIDFRTCQNKYIMAMGKLNDILHRSAETKRYDGVNIPKPKIPEFDGKITSWKGFRELYDDMVHNNGSISTSMKMHILKTHVKGDAAKLVSHIPPTYENYESCYKILCNRYENKRDVVGKLIDTVLAIKHQNAETAMGLKVLHDTVNECVMAIKSYNVNIDQWDPLLAHLIMKKLNATTILDYEKSLIDVKEFQKTSELLEYIEKRFLALSSAEINNGARGNTQSYANDKRYGEKNDVTIKCSYCEKAHSIYSCDDFKKMDSKKRNDWAKNAKACYKCLQFHKFGECKSKHACKKCDKSHSTLLHYDTPRNSSMQQNNINKPNSKAVLCATVSNENNDESAETIRIAANIATNNTKALLSTAMINVMTGQGEPLLMKALIDGGSQGVFIRESSAHLLKLKSKKLSVEIEGILSSKTMVVPCVNLDIRPRFESEYKLTAEAIVLKKLPIISSCVPANVKRYDHLQNLKYADPSFDVDKDIDVILGTVERAKIIKPGLIKSSEENAPIAENTEFGWIISGSCNSDAKLKIVSLVSHIEINEKLDRFFAAEDIWDDCEPISDNERYCEQHFIENTKRDANGKYIVKLPMKNKNDMPDLGVSRKTAVATLLSLEEKFKKNSSLREQYKQFIHEFIELGHMRLVKNDTAEMSYYLPHHCVIKESTTTKLRVVFNASQKTNNGKSLNDELLSGKMEQEKIMPLLMRLRKYKIALTGDLEKMYRQIWVDKSQTSLQRIVWRDAPNEPIRDYELLTITYGTQNAPYLAIRILKQLAEDVKLNYPEAAKIIANDFYMDDMITGFDDELQAMKMYHELKDALLQGGFNIRKFVSNSKMVMEHIPENDRETKVNDKTKTLGISYDQETDDFTCQLHLNQELATTKRKIFSEIASIYDPMGWLVPLTLKAKTIMQKIWTLQTEKGKAYEWDQQLPDTVIGEWHALKLQIPLINNLRIPRWLQTTSSSYVELHGFADASEVGYACVIFVRILRDDGGIHMQQLVAKSRMAPIKKLTIPRLELLAAELLARLACKVIDTMQMEFKRVCLWSDSKIVLAWIHGNPKRWKTFVASRITKIHQNTAAHNWYHVKGEENPADCGSRGLSPNELLRHELWWHGPRFLYDANYNYEDCEFDTKEEATLKVFTAVTSDVSILPKTNTFGKLQRVIAYVLRFIKKCKGGKIDGHVTTREKKDATIVIIKQVQKEHFSDEIRALKSGNNINSSSKIKSLCAFLDENGLLRVGGRLKHSELQYDTKHQMLLPKSDITNLIIDEAHRYGLHSGPRLTEAILRKRYWLINSQSCIRKQIKRCVKCARYNPKLQCQIMADLPSSRVKMAEKAFIRSAVDFAGPIKVKASKLRNAKIVKGYISIFVCMTTRALHIELVGDLTAESFVAALRRFVARRGRITDLYSDNGTNFVGANKILKELSEREKDEFELQLSNELVSKEIDWHFAPPGSPTFNGLAEAAVKTTKHHLLRAIGQNALTFEELTTLLYQIESVVNMRPLCPMSNDPNELSVLTPAHFLNLVPTTIPEENLEDTKANWLSRWQLVQRLHQQFWTKWKNEYLMELQKRNKWTTKRPNLEVGELVLIKDENLPASQWPMGRVQEVHPGDDDLTRVVSVKTANSVLKRGINKIAPLPVKHECSEKLVANYAGIKSRPIKKHAPYVSSILMAILASLVIPVHLAVVPSGDMEGSKMQITAFKNSPALYFKETTNVYLTASKWTIIAHLNYGQFVQELDDLEKVVDSLEKYYQHEAKVPLLGVPMMSIVHHIKSTLFALKERNRVLQPVRNRRAVLDFVGNIAHDLFGVLGSDFEKKYVHDTDLLMENENHMHLLLKNQTSVVEALTTVARDNEKTMKNQQVMLQQMNEEIHEVIKKDEVNGVVRTYITLVQDLLHQYESRQGAIFDAFMDARGDIVHPNLVTPQQMVEQIKLIKKHTDESLTVPDLHDIYRILSIKPMVARGNIFFKITVPLIQHQKYDAYRLYPVPIPRNGKYHWIVPEAEILITTHDRRKYTLLSESRFEKCIDYHETSVICNGIVKMYSEQARYHDCEWKILNHVNEISERCQFRQTNVSDVFINLNDNQWITVLPNKLQTKLICKNMIEHKTLAGILLMTLAPGCELAHNDVKIMATEELGESSVNIATHRVEMFNPQLPAMIRDQANSTVADHDFAKIGMEIENLKQQQQRIPHKIGVHDVHHYSVTYTIIAVVLCIWLIRLCKKKWNAMQKDDTEIKPQPRPRLCSMPTVILPNNERAIVT